MALTGPSARYQKQDITYWAPLGDNEFGVDGFAAPVLIKGRWEDRSELVRTSSGDEITSKAVVFVTRDVAENGYLAEGDRTTAYTDPRSTGSGALEIKAVVRVPDLRFLSEEYRAYL